MANGILDYQPFDPGRSILQGLLLRDQRDANRLNRDMLLKQQQQQDSQRNIQALGVLGQMLEGSNPEDRAAIYQSGVNFLGSQGFDVSDMPSELTNDAYNQLLTAKQFIGGRSKPVQFGEGRRVTRKVVDPNTGEEKNVNGILTEIRDPNTGQIVPKFTPIEGEFVSTLGETAEQQSQRKIEEAGGRETATLEARAKGLGPVKRAEFLASNNQTIASDYDESLSVIDDIDRAIDILSTAGNITGPIAGNFAKFGKDGQELESILTRLGIDRLANFKGATSERELAAAFRAGASMEQDAPVAIRRLKAQKRKIESSSDRLFDLLGESNQAIGKKTTSFPPPPANILQEASAAIQNGASRDAVIKRLKDNGYSAEGL